MSYGMYNGGLCRILLQRSDGIWIIPLPRNGKLSQPVCVLRACVAECEKPPVNEETPRTGAQIKTQQERIELLQPLICDVSAIYDKQVRQELLRKIEASSNKSKRTLLRWYYSYLAYGPDGLFPERKNKETRIPKEDEKNIRWAIRKYYYSSRSLSLVKTYEMMLVDRYVDEEGCLLPQYPSYSRFRHFFYNHMKNDISEVISQKGITYYQRNARPLYGKASNIAEVGVYELDATEADVYIASEYDHNQVIGRPLVYLAIDRATQLVTGFYIGWNGDENAVLSCLRNAVCDKVDFCKQYDIPVSKKMWGAEGLPGKLVTDRGKEFMGSRIQQIAAALGIEIEYLPPYRPELKGGVEKAFDLIQNQIKPLVLHKGGIMSDFAERGAPDYRSEATLTLREYTKLFIRAVINYNSTRILAGFVRTPEMAAAQVKQTPADLWNWYVKNEQSRMRPLVIDETAMLLLAREVGGFTRRGLEFRSLMYMNKNFNERCVTAGLRGKEEVTVAFLPDNTERVWLVEGEIYYEFILTEAYERYKGYSFDEVRAYLQKERDDKKLTQKELLGERVSQTFEMKRVVENAVDLKNRTANLRNKGSE